METRLVRALLIMAVASSFGCMAAEPTAATPHGADAIEHSRFESEQRELERRRARLQRQVLGELRKLREGRQASTNGAGPTEGGSPGGADVEDLVVFGGSSHELFLGCLCDEDRQDSVFNLKGEHGSDLSPVSIRNKFSPYGSNHDDTSACARRATHPPVVLTAEGKSLGLLTSNEQLKRRITTPSVIDWLTRMCSY